MEKSGTRMKDFMTKAFRLRDTAPDYPKVAKEWQDDILFLYCWVPFEYNSIKFKRICVESDVITPRFTEQALSDRMEYHIRKMQSAPASPCPLDRIIGIVQADIEKPVASTTGL